MSALSASALLLRSAVRRIQVVPRANVQSKPAKHPVSGPEQAFVLVVMFATILGPSGYILANLQNYKKRP